MTSPPPYDVHAPGERIHHLDPALDQALHEALDEAIGSPSARMAWPAARVVGPPRPVPVHVALVTGAVLIADGLAAMLAAYPDRVQLVDPSGLRPVPGDLLLVDVCESRSSGRRQVQVLVEQGHTSVFTFGPALSFEERTSLRAAGARGHVSVNLLADQLVTALEHAGQLSTRPRPVDAPEEERPRTVPLDDEALRAVGCTLREMQVVTLVCRGLNNDEIARELFLGINTVKTYIRHAYRKIGLTTRAQIAAWGITHGV